MLDKFALKFNKCALNIENDTKIKKINNLTIKNDFKSVSESRYFFIHHQHFDYKFGKEENVTSLNNST